MGDNCLKIKSFQKFNNKKTLFKVFLDFFANLFFTYCVIIGLALILFSSVTIECVVRGSSMLPTLNNYTGNKTDIVFVNTCDKDITYGDIVVCDAHGDVDNDIIKRVIGLAGDIIDIVYHDNEYKLELNGKIIEEDYIYISQDPRVPTNNRNGMEHTFTKFNALKVSKPELFDNGGKLIVPSKSIFVLGDNRNVSVDSSSLGTFTYDDIEGKVELIKYYGTSNFSFYYDYIIEGKFIKTLINML